MAFSQKAPSLILCDPGSAGVRVDPVAWRRKVEVENPKWVCFFWGGGSREKVEGKALLEPICHGCSGHMSYCWASL